MSMNNTEPVEIDDYRLELEKREEKQRHVSRQNFTPNTLQIHLQTFSKTLHFHSPFRFMRCTYL